MKPASNSTARHIRRAQHRERGRTLRRGVEHDAALPLAGDQIPEFGGFFLRAALRKVDQDRAYRVALARKRNAVEPVRAVLAGREARRRFVRRRVG